MRRRYRLCNVAWKLHDIGVNNRTQTDHFDLCSEVYDVIFKARDTPPPASYYPKALHSLMRGEMDGTPITFIDKFRDVPLNFQTVLDWVADAVLTRDQSEYENGYDSKCYNIQISYEVDWAF